MRPHRRQQPRPLARAVLAALVAASLGARGAALYTQHGPMGLLPCAWCVLQRLGLLAVAAAALLGLLLPGMPGRRLGALLAGLMAVSGMAMAAWQHWVAAASASCAMTLADRLMGWTGLDSRWPEVFAAYASCADAKAKLLGLPYEFYSLALFALLALAALLVWRRPR